MQVEIGVCLSALLIYAVVFCDDDTTVGDLPEEIIEQLHSLRKHTLDVTERCKRPRAVEVRLLLYTRNNPNIPITLDKNNIQQIDPSKKVILLVHGWLSQPNSSGISQLKDAYLKRYDCNVILVDWSQMAWKLYTTASCHVVKISNYIAQFLCESNIPLNKVHVVGHSMGGQIAGIVGQFVNVKCHQQIARITGLDPSGPLFQNSPHTRRLDHTDALFVDVIHTDQVKFGYTGNCGHIDFHPNCGQHQPGCPSVTDVVNNTLLSDVFCSHRRSVEYMIESVMSDNFIAVSCGMCPRHCRPDILTEIYTVMGEGCRSVPRSSHKFYLNTTSSPPYGKGWALYDAKLP